MTTGPWRDAPLLEIVEQNRVRGCIGRCLSCRSDRSKCHSGADRQAKYSARDSSRAISLATHCASGNCASGGTCSCKIFYETLQLQVPPLAQLPEAHPPSVNIAPSFGTIIFSLTL